MVRCLRTRGPRFWQICAGESFSAKTEKLQHFLGSGKGFDGPQRREGCRGRVRKAVGLLRIRRALAIGRATGLLPSAVGRVAGATLRCVYEILSQRLHGVE